MNLKIVILLSTEKLNGVFYLKNTTENELIVYYFFLELVVLVKINLVFLHYLSSD